MSPPDYRFTPPRCVDPDDTPQPRDIQSVTWHEVVSIKRAQKLDGEKLDSQAARLAHIEQSIVSIHGQHGTNGKIGNLSSAILGIQSELKESKDRAWWVVGILVGVFVAVIAGVFVVRDRLTTMELNSGRNREDIKEIVRKVEHWHEYPAGFPGGN